MPKREKPNLPENTEWPLETARWFEAWRSSRATNEWDERQWQYMMDTALVHAMVYGSGDFGMLPELHKRLAFMGLYFDQE